jgi:hypothetical protein
VIYFYIFAALVTVAYWHLRFKDWPTSIISFLVGAVVAVALFYGPMFWQASDVEILSGSVAKKQRVYDPETEYYDCGKDSHGNTKTCSREIPRWRWDVISDYDDSYSEHTYQSIRAPEIYSATQIGDPFASTKRFMNYQNVSEQSVVVDRFSAEEYKGWLPSYPHIYAGFKVQRGFSNTPYMDQRVLSKALSVAQKRWGPMHGVNVSVIVLDHRTVWHQFINALAAKWKGGKKNDAVLVLGLDESGRAIHGWAFSRSADEKLDEMGRPFTTAFYVNAHEALYQQKGPVTIDTIINSIDGSLKLFQREDLGRYDFLRDEYSPPFWLIILSVLVIAGVVSITVNKVCERLDSRGGYRRMNRRFGMF